MPFNMASCPAIANRTQAAAARGLKLNWPLPASGIPNSDGRSPPLFSFDLFQGPREVEHQDPREQNYTADPKGEDHSFINKLVNSTPPATSAIQTRLFEFKGSHWLHPNDSRSRRFEESTRHTLHSIHEKNRIRAFVRDRWSHIREQRECQDGKRATRTIVPINL